MVLHHKFIENAKRHPKKIALVEQATGTEVTYERLLISSLVFKDVFEKFSSKFVGIMIPPAPGCIVAILGALFAGKTPVLINYSTGAIENSLYAQKKCGFKPIVTSKKLLEKLSLKPIKDMIFMEDLAAKVNIIHKLKGKFLSSLSAKTIINKIIAPAKEDDNVVLLFTSGSERDPRAVQLTHKNIYANVWGVLEVFHMDERDVFITNLPYFHVFGLMVNLWVPLTVGGMIATTPNPLDYKTIVEGVRKYGVTVFVATPTFHYGYLQRALPGDFESVRICISGADKMPAHIREEYMKVHKLEIRDGYGTTETSPIVSFNVPGATKQGSIGKVLPGAKVKIVHLETGETLPPGEEGKILVKGDIVMKGYYNDIEETSYRIRDGWYDTGDMGIMDEEGYLYHRGRLRRFVKIGGEMVSLVKVEDEINNILADETICCVVDVPDDVKGSEIVAVLTSKEIDQKEVKKRLAKVLPPVAIPKKFKVMDEIPMSPNGKVNFRAVEEICRNQQMEGN